MKTKELNRYLIRKLNRTEYMIRTREEEVDDLTEKVAGFEQLLELNQKLLMWALEKLATYNEESKVKQIAVPMSEVHEVYNKYQATSERTENGILMKFKDK